MQSVFVINSVATSDLKHLGTGDLGTDWHSLPYVNLAMVRWIVKVIFTKQGKDKMDHLPIHRAFEAARALSERLNVAGYADTPDSEAHHLKMAERELDVLIARMLEIKNAKA